MGPKTGTGEVNVGSFSATFNPKFENSFNSGLLVANKDMTAEQMRDFANDEANQRAQEAARPLFVQDNSVRTDISNRDGNVIIGANGNGAGNTGNINASPELSNTSQSQTQPSAVDKTKTPKAEKLPKGDGTEPNTDPAKRKKEEEEEKKVVDDALNPTSNKKPLADPLKKITGDEESAEVDIDIKEKEKAKKQKDSAEDFLQEALTPEVDTSIKEAGKDEKGFLFHLARSFEGGKWKRHLTTIAGSLAALGGMKLLGGATIGLLGGAWGAGILGVGLAAMGVYNGYKAIKQFSEVSKREGKGMWDMLKDKDVRNGALLGGAISGFAKTAAMFVPGVGAIFGVVAATAAEIASATYLESKLNKDQQTLLDSIQSSYERRRYKYLKDKGYVRNGENGTPEISLHSILADIKNAPTDLEKKTAQKTAIAALKMLYEETKDDKYKFVEYTVDDKGVKKQVQVDITKIGLVEEDAAVIDAKYKNINLAGTDIEKIIDTLNVDKLSADVTEAYSKVSDDKKKAMALSIVERFVGLEAADVERLLSAEKTAYLQSLHFSTGYHATTGVINAIYTVYGGVTTTTGAIHEYNATSTTGTTVADTSMNQEYQTFLNDSDATVVETMTDASGHHINGIDINGDNQPDFYHDVEDQTFTYGSQAGVEHALTLSGTEGELHPFDSTSTGINGTIVDSNGVVTAVTYMDSNGHINTLSNANLAGNISIMDANGTEVPATFTNIQADGSVDVSVNGHVYHTNLAHLDSISETTPGVETGTSSTVIPIESGSSVNSLLHDTMAQAKTMNPNLAQYDDIQLERMLYQGAGVSANDSAIRSEVGLGTPVRTDNTFDWSKSPTILGWLEQLNGAPLNIDSTTTMTAPVTSEYTATFLNPVLDTVTENGISGKVGVGVFPILGLIASSAFSYLASKGKLGGLTSTTTISDSTKSASSALKQADGKAEKKEVLQNDILTQVLTKVKEENFIKIDDKKYQKTKTGWVLVEKNAGSKKTNKNKTPLTNEQIIDLLNARPEKDKNVELTKILDVAVEDKSELTLADGTVIQKKFEKKKGNNPGKTINVVTWVVTTAGSDTTISKKMNSAQVATLILKTSITPTQTATGTPGVPNPGTGSGTAEQAEAGEKKKSTFDAVAQSVLTKLATVKDSSLHINGVTYKYDPNSKLWMKDGIFDKGAKQFTDKEVITQWKASELLVKDLEFTLKRFDGLAASLTIDSEKFDRTAVGRILEKKTWNNVVYEKVANNKWKRESGNTALPEEVDDAQIAAWEVNAKPTTTPGSRIGDVWKSKNNSLEDKQMSAKIVALIGREDTAKAEATQNEAETKGAKETEKNTEKEKSSFGRKLLKTGLIVSTVVASFFAAGSGAGIPITLGAAAVAGTSFLTQVFSERRASKLVAEQLAIREKGGNIDAKKLAELKKKEETSRKIAKIANGILKYSAGFAILTGGLTFFAPTIQSLSVQIIAKASGFYNGLQITPITSPFGTSGTGILNFGTPPTPPIVPAPSVIPSIIPPLHAN